MFGLFDSRPVRLLGAAALATTLCVVLGTRVFTEFDALRVKLVRMPVPAADGAVRINTATDARAARLATPVALIAVIDNPGAAAQPITIVVNDQAVCTATIAPGSTTRMDCVVSQRWITGDAHTIVVSGTTPAWSLEFLEIATHHGSTSRLLPFYILPDISTNVRRPSWTTVVVTWALLWGLLVIRPAVWTPRVTRVHTVIVAGVLLMMAAMMASPVISLFLVMMPLGSFVTGAAVLLAPQLWRLGSTAIVQVRRVPWGRWLWHPHVVVAAVALLVVAVYVPLLRYSVNEFAGNYSGLIRISEDGFDRSPLLRERADIRGTLALSPNEGYDGQFMYFAAFDPMLRQFREDPRRYRDVMDAAPYRYGRIGMPLMVRALAGDRWQWYPMVMIGLVLAGVAVSAAVVARLAQMSGMSAAWGLIVLAIPGFWQSARVVLPEPLAAATMLLAYVCVLHRRVALAAILLASSLLIRETSVVFVAALVIFLPRVHATVRDRIVLATAVLPLIAWRVYVAATLWTDWGWQGLYYESHNVSVPLMGIVQLWNAVAAGTYHPAVPELSVAAVWLPLLFVAVAAVAFVLRTHVDRHIAVALAVYSLMSLALTYPKVWGHAGNAQRASFEAFVLLAIASVSTPSMAPRYRRMILVCWLLSAAFVAFGAHDALHTRASIFGW